MSWKGVDDDVRDALMKQCNVGKEDTKKFMVASFGTGRYANSIRESLLIALEKDLKSLEDIVSRMENDGCVWTDYATMDDANSKYSILGKAILAYKVVKDERKRSAKSVITYCSTQNRV